MNEGKGEMLRLVRAYRNGAITDKVLKEICDNNGWEYEKDGKFGILIYPRLSGRRGFL